MKISNLRKMYGKQTILNNISVEAFKGQIIGLVGNNDRVRQLIVRISTQL